MIKDIVVIIVAVFFIISITIGMFKEQIVVITLFFTLIFGIILEFGYINYLRFKRKYPPRGLITVDDIVRLVSEEQTLLAVWIYKELYTCSTVAAEKAVQQIKSELEAQSNEAKPHTPG